MKTTNRLPFWHFFHQIEKELSYERWIDKYRLFQHALTGGDEILHWDTEGDEWQSFRRFCKILYLQDYRDEARFDQILNEAIEIEKRLILDDFNREVTIAAPVPAAEAQERAVPPAAPPAAPPMPDKGQENRPQAPRQSQQNEPDKDAEMYFHPQVDESAPAENGYRNDSFLHTDEYFPVTRRQMGVAWQYLRRKEKKGFSDLFDLPATVLKVAKEGMFIEMVRQIKLANRADNLIFFADTHGTMTPFHEFTRRLITTARNEGGHTKAPVYYFQNYPAGFVYKYSNLSGPVKVLEALSRTNRQATLAIVISDAGAAHYDMSDEDKIVYEKSISHFIRQLMERVSHIIWLNPMPQHRWEGTPATSVQKQVTVMAPVFDEGSINFPNTVRLLLKQKNK